MHIVRFQNLKTNDRQCQRAPWPMRSFSDAQTLSDRTEEQKRYSYGQARPGAVGVRGEGDLWGRGV